jgi:hypothetical protein
MELCDSVLWHVKHGAFQACHCTATGCSITKHHHDPVQALFPTSFRKKLRKKSHITLPDRGAVIFGQNRNLHWQWGDNGPPERGDPPKAADNVALPSIDSGLGSSLGSSASPTGSGSGAASESSDDGAPRGLKRPFGSMIEKISKKMRV